MVEQNNIVRFVLDNETTFDVPREITKTCKVVTLAIE